mgnify:CR=1 FL=1
MMNEWKARETICEVGRRLYNRWFAAANDGNITFRLGENRFLCTPTGVSKGFMKPEHLAIVDIDGNQLSGEMRRSCEALLHLSIYNRFPTEDETAVATSLLTQDGANRREVIEDLMWALLNTPEFVFKD